MNWSNLTALQKTDHAEQLIAKGYSCSQAAKALGTTKNAVAGALDRGRDRSPRVRTTPENRQPSQAGKTAALRGSTAIAQEKARRARAKALGATADAPTTDEEATGRKLLASEIWAPLPGSTPVGLMERTGCTWAVGLNPTLFCNEPIADHGHDWCARHHAVGNRPVVVGAETRRAQRPPRGAYNAGRTDE